ncbi:glycosyltransferase involved in cell wall biosynthesis [Paenibacillus sp. JGP012]|uniref:glycosyltransferase family 4 protein n=1 Tax=Paenibacillus sp. JGP012 TaxID=2735914 RepID=UPI001610E484|nr:glycosyltransferase family 4 protein [Paenibacillus sp. JGP012]MBB6019783.1 glycosyltransferase involved in cell wall biosynthesis [Paenibacillus sp. JGP012]
MGIVSILTHSFTDGYNREFSRVFGGRLERYILDLCRVIRGLGHIPEVHQLSYFEAFQTRTEQIDVYGYDYDMNNVPEAFDRMAAAARGPIIYASCLWQPIHYKPGSLGICHGINWDRPGLPLDTKRQVAEHIQLALDGLVRIVSVDSHFQTFCRAACTYVDSEQIVLIPNAVDTSYFIPAPPRRTLAQQHKQAWLEIWKQDTTLQTESADLIITASEDAAGDSHAETESSNLQENGPVNDQHTNRIGDSNAHFSYKEEAARLTVHPEVECTEDEPAASRAIRVLYPRRISSERGIIPMMLAADKLLGTFPNVEIEFAGELVEGSTVGRAFRYWQRTHPHTARILQHTYDFRDIRDAYHQADIAVIPTLFSEGTSYACLEAMSCGLPVIASNVGGLNDLIQDGFNGLLVPPGEQALTAALVRLVQDRAERERLGIYARETALSYDLSIWQSRWNRVLEAFLTETGIKEGIRT